MFLFCLINLKLFQYYELIMSVKCLCYAFFFRRHSVNIILCRCICNLKDENGFDVFAAGGDDDDDDDGDSS